MNMKPNKSHIYQKATSLMSIQFSSDRWQVICLALLIVALVSIAGCSNNNRSIVQQSVDEKGRVTLAIFKQDLRGDERFQKVIYYPNMETRCVYQVIPTEGEDLQKHYLNHGDFTCFYNSGDTLAKGRYTLGVQKEKYAFFPDGTLQGYSKLIDDSLTYTWVFYNNPQLLREFSLRIKDIVIYTSEYDSLKRPTYTSGPPFFLTFDNDVIDSETMNRILGLKIYLATDINVTRKIYLDSLKIRDYLPFLDVSPRVGRDSFYSGFNFSFHDTIQSFTVPIVLRSTDMSIDSTYIDYLNIDIKN